MTVLKSRAVAWLSTTAIALCAPQAVADTPDAGSADKGDAGTGAVELERPSLPADRMPVMSLDVEPKEASVGQAVHWKLKVRRRTGDRVHLSGGASFGTLEVKSKDVSTEEVGDDWVEETLDLTLIGFEPGEVEIPAQKVTVVDGEGRIAEVETDNAAVSIKSLIANEPEPKLKEDVGTGVSVIERSYTPLWILGGIALAGVIVLGTLLVRRLLAMRERGPLAPPPPPRPAEEIALEKLEELKRSNLLNEGLIKEFHVRLSEALREYLGNRYGFDSLELSTEELVGALKRAKIEPTTFDETVLLVEDTDLVKFAKVIPTLDESRDWLDRTFDLVKMTTPVAAPQATETEQADSTGSSGDRGGENA